MFALASTPDSIVSALETAFTTVASNATDAITGILPIALPVMGGVLVVGLGIKIFKKVAGK